MIAPMTAALATPRQTISLREDITRGKRSPLRVDREAGVIYRIKILGFESANSRRYEASAIRKAMPLYEGAKAFCDHPERASQMRAGRDAIGVWRHPVLEADGLYADLHFFTKHPLAESVCEDAERGLGVFGASHNADGRGENRGGVFVVGEITEVRSVDLVTEPATVSNLWEGKTVQKKVSDVLLERVLPALKAGRAKRLKALCESLPETVLMEDSGVEGPTSDHHDHIYGAMKACKEAGESEKALALHKLLKPDDDEEGGDDGAKEKPMKEDDEDDDEVAEEGKERNKLPAPGVEALTEARALALCKAAGVEPTLEVTAALAGASLDQGLAILTLAKRHAPAPASPPRSAPRGGHVMESAPPKDAKAWAERLLG